MITNKLVSLQADWQIPETETDKQWPSEGHIQMEHYGTRYRPGLDLVLKDLTCDIAPGEKVHSRISLYLLLFDSISAGLYLLYCILRCVWCAKCCHTSVWLDSGHFLAEYVLLNRISMSFKYGLYIYLVFLNNFILDRLYLIQLHS